MLQAIYNLRPGAFTTCPYCDGTRRIEVPRREVRTQLMILIRQGLTPVRMDCGSVPCPACVYTSKAERNALLQAYEV